MPRAQMRDPVTSTYVRVTGQAGLFAEARLMHRWGEVVRPVLFRRPAAGR
jgi:hypothetical protein